MTPINRNDKEAKSDDVIIQNIEILKGLFPEAVSEGKIDLSVLKEIMGAALLPEEEKDEKYGLNWFGKRKARQIALTPSTGTLRPSKKESVDWDTTKNLMIEGDNLEVLKLLQKSYAGKVKLIYIDPPYNTGGDFVYPDNFKDNIRNYLELTEQLEGGAKIQTNSEVSGRFHTDWLNMMYPRIKLAKTLLDENGVMYISIDDNEIDNIRRICDEIFGEENRIAIICHKSRASVSNDKIISSNHNFILLYARNERAVFEKRSLFGLEPDLEGFNQKDAKGAFKYVPVDGPGGGAKGNPYYSFLGVTGYWRFSEERMKAMHKEGLIEKLGNGLQQKYYLEDAKKTRKTDTTWWDDKYYTSTASSRLKELMGGSPFDNPKPVELMQRMIQLSVRNENDLVLDFFAGSGTTGHSVYQQCANDSIKRRFILVQLPEPLDPKNKDQKEAAEYCANINKPLTIAELTKERLRKAGNIIRKEFKKKDSDIGFRVFKLDTSNILPWEPEWDSLEELIKKSVDHVKDGRGDLDILYELLLKFGLDLVIPIEEKKIDEKIVYAIGAGTLFVCLNKKIRRADAEPLALGICEWHKQLAPIGETTCVFLDSGFVDDVAKTNLSAILNQYGLENVRSL